MMNADTDINTDANTPVYLRVGNGGDERILAVFADVAEARQYADLIRREGLLGLCTDELVRQAERTIQGPDDPYAQEIIDALRTAAPLLYAHISGVSGELMRQGRAMEAEFFLRGSVTMAYLLVQVHARAMWPWLFEGEKRGKEDEL